MAPMTRRRSARLASTSKIPLGASAPQNLASLAERDETLEEDGLQQPQVGVESPFSPASRPPRTPASSSPSKPSRSEMHPSKTYTAQGPPSSALRLGFTDIQPGRFHSCSKSHNFDEDDASEQTAEETAARLQDTPSKISAVPPSSAFTFRFTRQSDTANDLGLSDEARRMMEELREEATKIRADLEVQREQEQARAEAAGEVDIIEVSGRRIAKPKPRAGRYSAAHTAEFQKMDSIANHPSAFRAAPSRSTPLKASVPTAPLASTAGPIPSQTRGLKRTQSKANLDDTPGSATHPQTATKPAVPASASRSVTKKRFNPLFGGSSTKREARTMASPHKSNLVYGNVSMSAAKRVKQHISDDTSSSRPMSRDGSFLPRPATVSGKEPSANVTHSAGLTRSHTLASLMTPTKTSLAHAAGGKSPEPKSSMLQKTPSKSCLKKSATTNNLLISTHGTPNRATPTTAAASAKSALPLPTGPAPMMHFSKTPAPARVMKPLPRFPVPATTPRRRLSKHVAFTPTTERAVLAARSPSLFRSGIPRSASKQSLREAAVEDAGLSGPAVPSIHQFGATVAYPDLSRHFLSGQADAAEEEETPVSLSVREASPSRPLPSVPGTFSFRSDKTINFGTSSPGGFGSSPGQVSLRQVRQSMAPASAPAPGPTSLGVTPRIPGSFPGNGIFSALVATDGPNKENTKPVPINIPHGIANKKRHRVSAAEEQVEQEALDRAAKKRRNEIVPEGEALMAPRLTTAGGTGSTRATPQKAQAHVKFSGSVSGKTPASGKKRPVLSMSRLNSLARPKLRK